MSEGLFLSLDALKRVSPALASALGKATNDAGNNLHARATTIVPLPLDHGACYDPASSFPVTCGSALVKQGGTSVIAAISISPADSPSLTTTVLTTPIASPRLPHATASATVTVIPPTSALEEWKFIKAGGSTGQFYSSARRLASNTAVDVGSIAAIFTESLTSSNVAKHIRWIVTQDDKKLSLAVSVDLTLLTFDGNLFDPAVLACSVALAHAKIPRFAHTSGHWRITKADVYAGGDDLLQRTSDGYPVLFSSSFVRLPGRDGSRGTLKMDPTIEDSDIAMYSVSVISSTFTKRADKATTNLHHWGGGGLDEDTWSTCKDAALRRTHQLVSDLALLTTT